MAMTPTTFFTVTVPLALMSFLLTLLLFSDGLLVVSNNGGSFGVSAAYPGALAAPPASPNGRSGSGRAGGIPLVGEDTNNRRRKGKKNTDCHFGRTKYELGETWHPDLGPPFGVLSCVECECVSVQKKRRIVGRVKCRNTKHECPEPNCDDPVLLTGRCCKTCPQNEIQMEQKPKDDTDKSGHEYASLLTSDSGTIASSTSTFINAAASGRFVLHKRNLHYSIHYIGTVQPTFVAFTDEKGHIIEDQLITHATLLQNSTYKICGVWLKVPKYYRESLANEEIFVRLLNPSLLEGDIVVGRLTKYSSAALKKETFSTLLTPSSAADGDSRSWMTRPSGMAIISTASVNGAVHFYVVLKNMYIDREQGKDQMVSVRLESLHKDDVDAVVIEETFVMAEIVKDNVLAQLKMDFDAKVFRQMARGKLLLSVTSKQNVDSNRISGLISPKVSCTVYHAILSVAVDDETGLNSATTGAGQAVMRLTDDGNIIYKIQIEGMQGIVTYVGLETLNKKRFRPVHNLTSSFKDGWANGTLNRLSARDIELLTSAELHVVIGSDRHSVHLTGQVKERLYGEAQSGDFFPLLLRGGTGPAAGQAWIAVDDNCRLFYEVVVGHQQPFQQQQSNKKLHGGRGKDLIDEVGMVELVDIGVMADDRTSSASRELQIRQEFTGNEVEDVADDISKPAFARLESGNAILHVSINSTISGNVSRVDLQARVNNLRVPVACLPDRSQNEVPLVSVLDTEERSDDPAEGGDVVVTEPYRCTYEGRLVEDGSHWTPSYNACLICSCRRRRVVCESTVCPSVSCLNAKIPAGECCPVCSEVQPKTLPINSSSRGCYFDGDKKFHKLGSKWYPYLTPFGFSQCALCTCNATTLSVNCTKIICKPLSCPEKDAYRKNPKDCCKTCPDPPVTQVSNIEAEQHDQGSKKTPDELLAEGGCKSNGEVMPNGKEWHPRVQPFGDIRCVRCSCKDGETTCKRLKCPPTNCHNKISVDNECCPRCADGHSGALNLYGRPKSKNPGL